MLSSKKQIKTKEFKNIMTNYFNFLIKVLY